MRREPIPRYVRCDVYRRDRYRCRYCAKRVTWKNGTLDHVIPVCQWGPDAVWNLVTCCWTCNAAKGSKTLEALGWLLLPQGMTQTQAEAYGLRLPTLPERYRRGRRSKKDAYVNRPCRAA